MTFSPPLPKNLGPYLLGETLGENGLMLTMTGVHQADGSEVVLTLVSADQVNGEARVRFGREAQKVASAQFKYVLPPTQWGEEYGWLWCATRRVPGDHTGHLMRTNGIPPKHISLELAHQVALGLEEIHAKGFTHGALSPASVLVDSDARVRLLHFPWTRIIPGLEEGYLHPCLMSILPFTAPEVAATGIPSRQGDAYSLGALLFFLLQGMPVHWADDPHSLLHLLQTSNANFDLLRLALPDTVIEMMEEMLAIDPEDRPVNWPALVQRIVSATEDLADQEDSPETVVLQSSQTPPNEPPTAPGVRPWGGIGDDEYEVVPEEPDQEPTIVLPQSRPLKEEPETDHGVQIQGPVGEDRYLVTPDQEEEKTDDGGFAEVQTPAPQPEPQSPPVESPSVKPPPEEPKQAPGVPKPAAAYLQTPPSDQPAPSAAPSKKPADKAAAPDAKAPAKPAPSAAPASTGATPRTVVLIAGILVVLAIVFGGGFFLMQGRNAIESAAPTETASQSVEKDPQYTQTANTLLALGKFVQLYENTNGRYPVARDIPGNSEENLSDAWGTPIDIRQGFVVSAGEDKKWDTEDDLFFDPKYSTIGGPVGRVDLPDTVLATQMVETK